ncbi:MAG TPA: hypothetical protein VE225_08145, partial [Rubrobacteraceae bacterium]|nr:hypothetical protein [Rubrobacteraceae bacterium]
MFRSKPLEERLVAAVRSELAGSAADLEGRRREYQHRLESKKEARAALENAEAERRRLHSEMLALKKRFWEEHYKNGQDTTAESGPEVRSLERAVEEAEKALKRARAKFEEADFDEAAQRAVLLAEANAVEREAGRRLDSLEGTLVDLIVGLREDLKEAARALREECQDAREEVCTPKPAEDPRTPARPPRGRGVSSGMRGLLTKASTREPGGRNLPVAAFFALVGLFCLWVGLVEIKGAVPLALVLVGSGLVNAATAVLYALPTGGRPRTPTRTWIAGISLA